MLAAILTAITTVAAIFGGVVFVLGTVFANGAPQEAAAAASGLACALIPYVLLRCVLMWDMRRSSRELLDAVRVMRDARIAPSSAGADVRPVRLPSASGLGASSPIPQRPPE